MALPQQVLSHHVLSKNYLAWANSRKEVMEFFTIDKENILFFFLKYYWIYYWIFLLHFFQVLHTS